MNNNLDSLKQRKLELEELITNASTSFKDVVSTGDITLSKYFFNIIDNNIDELEDVNKQIMEITLKQAQIKAKVISYYLSKGISVDINSFTERELELKADLIDLIEEIKKIK